MKIDGCDAIGPSMAIAENAAAAGVTQYSKAKRWLRDSILRRATETQTNLALVKKGSSTKFFCGAASTQDGLSQRRW
jgi:hypothetical protein